jgi:Icc-related predicted phosphoesterase
MKIWHISDTHCLLDKIQVPADIDMVIHTGDATNVRDPFKNEPEMWRFIERYAALDIPVKIFIAGNHDGSLQKGLVTKADFDSRDIHYLYNDSVTIEGLKIWGSPFSPTFGDWSFGMARHKIGSLWDTIPEDTDIVLTHGPPVGVLDITNRRDNLQEQCGCRSLMKRIREIQPKAVMFGHIHNTKDVCNAGTKQLAGLDTIFSNGSCVTDGKRGQITSHGNVITGVGGRNDLYNTPR